MATQIEQQLQQMVNAITILQQQLAASDASRVALETEVQGMREQPAPPNPAGGSRVGIDTRNLGRPASFVGTDETWRDWCVVFRSYSAIVNPRLQELMEDAERESSPEMNETLDTAEDRVASTELYHLLLHSCQKTALDRVINAGSSEGLRAWQLLVERFDPRIRSRAAGHLLGLLQYDFSGDVLAKVESFERALSQYESSSNEIVSEALRIGIVLNRIQDSELSTHLMLNAERLKTWSAFRKEMVDVSRAKAAAAGAYSKVTAGAAHAPMDVDALNRAYSGKGPQCWKCNEYGHMSRDCWQKGKGDKGKSKGKGNNKGGKRKVEGEGWQRQGREEGQVLSPRRATEDDPWNGQLG